MDTSTALPPIMNASQFILYACPTGELAQQLDRFFQRSRDSFGENTAHRYMPHISLTGFYRDQPASIALYVGQLNRIVLDHMARQQPQVALKGLHFADNFYGIEIESAWLKAVVDDFIALTASPSRQEAIRKKDWLHLSLTYDFPAHQADGLRIMAEEMVEVTAQVGWEIRFYERQPDNVWVLHGAWPIG